MSLFVVIVTIGHFNFLEICSRDSNALAISFIIAYGVEFSKERVYTVRPQYSAPHCESRLYNVYRPNAISTDTMLASVFNR